MAIFVSRRVHTIQYPSQIEPRSRAIKTAPFPGGSTWRPSLRAEEVEVQEEKALKVGNPELAYFGVCERQTTAEHKASAKK